MSPVMRMLLGVLALSAGLALIVASGPDVLADPLPSDPICNNMYEDTTTKPCLDTAILCEHQDSESNCKMVSPAKHVESFPNQCVSKTDHYCGEELRQCWRNIACKYDAGKCVETGTGGPWTSVKGPKGTDKCTK